MRGTYRRVNGVSLDSLRVGRGYLYLGILARLRLDCDWIGWLGCALAR